MKALTSHDRKSPKTITMKDSSRSPPPLFPPAPLPFKQTKLPSGPQPSTPPAKPHTPQNPHLLHLPFPALTYSDKSISLTPGLSNVTRYVVFEQYVDGMFIGTSFQGLCWASCGG